MTQVLPAASDSRVSQKRSCNDEGDSPAPYRRSKTNSGSKSNPSTRRFACPFVVAAPTNFEKTSCYHRGWPDIPRLKEHLYRRHYQRHIACDRCLQSFQQEKDLLSHRREPVPCEIVEMIARDPIIHGMDEKTVNVLKSCKRSSVVGDEEKWYEIWDALFPDRQRPDSPHAPTRLVQPPDILFAKYLEQYLKAELPSLLKQHLEVSSVTKTEFEAVVETVSTCLESAIRQYTGQPETPPAASTILEADLQSRLPIPRFLQATTYLPEVSGDFHVFTGDTLTKSPTYMPADDISTPLGSLSCARTITPTDISSTPYSICDASIADTSFLPLTWPDETSELGWEPYVNLWDEGKIGSVSPNTGIPYHISAPSVDFNFSQTDHPATFTGVISNDSNE